MALVSWDGAVLLLLLSSCVCPTRLAVQRLMTLQRLCLLPRLESLLALPEEQGVPEAGPSHASVEYKIVGRSGGGSVTADGRDS